MARKSFTLNKSTLGARAIFLLIKGSRAAVNAQDDSASNFSHLLHPSVPVRCHSELFAVTLSGAKGLQFVRSG
jgi:hypothetical protein